MIDQKHIDRLSPRLKSILDAEMECGNTVEETYQGWASEEHIFVRLKYPFKTDIRRDIQGVTYREIDDRHYWKAEYDDEEDHQTLACSF